MGRKVGVDEERTTTDVKKKVDNTTDPSPGPFLGSQSHWERAAMQHCEC